MSIHYKKANQVTTMKKGNILENIFKSRKSFEECSGKKQIWDAKRIEMFTDVAVNLVEKNCLLQ